MLIKDWMSKSPVTAKPATSIMKAAKLMKENGFHRLPVADDDGKLVGIGSTIYVQGPNGEIKKIRPVTAAELAARAAAANFDSVMGSPQATPVASTNAQLSADEADSEPKSKAVKKQ